MNILTLLASQLEKPGGLWSTLINWLHGGIGNFGWTVLLVTIFVKIIVSPLEFITKLNSKKQTLIQQKCAPQVAKIQKKFGKDTQSIRVQTNALYKREGLTMGVSCVFMIIHLVISLTIFMTFYSSLNKNSAYQTIYQFEQLSTVYTNKNYELLKDKNDEIDGYTISTDDEAKKFINEFNIGLKLTQLIEAEKKSDITLSEDKITYYTDLYEKNKDIVQTITNESINAVIAKWKDVKSTWLWVDNIWVSDSTIYPFPVYENFMEIISSGGYGQYIEEYAKSLNEQSPENVLPEEDTTAYQSSFKDYYNTVASIVNSKGGRKKNGYFILAILAAVITYLSQVLTERSSKKLKNEKAKLVAQDPNGSSMQVSMKVMKFLLPVIMVTFVLRSSASFGIYIFASNIIAIVINEISAIIINKITHQKQLEVEEYLEKEANRLIKKGKLQENK